MINTARVLIGCATKEKNKGNSNLETEYLFKTINQFAGSLKHSKKLACFLENPDEKILNVLNELKVTISITEPLDNRSPPSHKIRIIEEAVKEDIDYIVMLDTDIVACADFSNYVEGPHIKATYSFGGVPFVEINQWKNLFQFFGLELSEKDLLSNNEIKKIIPYYNTGVLIIPIQHARLLFETWKNYVYELCDNENKLPGNFGQKSFFFDQIGFSLALADKQLPFKPLPRSMNFEIPIADNTNGSRSKYFPILIHHLHRISDNGDIFHCAFEKANKKIDMINKYLQKTRKTQFDNNNAVRTSYILEILFRQGDFQQVIRRLSNLTMDNKDARSQFHLARALHKTGQKSDEALDRYRIAIENGFPNPFIIHFNRGSLYLKLGNLEEAKKEFESALNLKPEHEGTKRKLEKMKKDLGN